MFYGIYYSEIISLNDETCHSVKPENYFVLDLPLLDDNRIADNIYDCFDYFTKSENLEGDNAWFNEKTGEKENIRKQISFWNFPKILVITLKRFTPDGRYKINKQVDFPIENLNLSKYVKGYNKSSYIYDLYGVCNHYGGILGGHYTCYVKNAENVWVHFNDNFVEKIENVSNIITPSVYCLFYRKKNNLL
jgi:ubiquitin C-terminal hydrolase